MKGKRQMAKVITMNEQGQPVDSVTGEPIKGIDPTLLQRKDSIQPLSKPLEQNTSIPIKTTIPTIPSTKYELTKDSVFKVKFTIGFDEFNNLGIVDEDLENYEKLEHHWVEFRMWTYGEEIQWRNQCISFSEENKMHVLDTMKFDELKIRNLIKCWSFEKAEAELKLLHINDYLVDESYNFVMNSLHHHIVKHIIDGMNQELDG